MTLTIMISWYSWCIGTGILLGVIGANRGWKPLKSGLVSLVINLAVGAIYFWILK